jgi:hypothetical protein
MKPISALALASMLLTGCAADGAPIEGDLVVTEAGLAAPIAVGTTCTFRLRPAWRQGVDCQLLVTCPSADGTGTDLFGGRRVGGYAAFHAAISGYRQFIDLDAPGPVHDVAAFEARYAGLATTQGADLLFFN